MIDVKMAKQLLTNDDPHGDQPVLTAGPDPESAAATLILVHGRGAPAETMLSLFDEINVDNIAAISPQAANHTWYPHSFLASLDANQPFLDSALRRIDSLVKDLIARGIPSERIALLGFSQGACLVSEYVARHPRRFGAAMILTGGLIGPPSTPRDYTGSLDGTPVFIASSDPDPHVPFERVIETDEVLAHMGAKVERRRYPHTPHTVVEDEIVACRELLKKLANAS
jgi:predicted esterase